MFNIFSKKTNTQEIKKRARRTLSKNFSKESKSYVIDTSAVINKFIHPLIKKGLKGKIIIPNAVMAELENQANHGRQEGFTGLEEIASLHKIKDIKIVFEGLRPNEMQIRYAKSGEIDALIREIARNTKSILLTADLVQAKSAQAYGLEVLFIQPKFIPVKKKFWSRFFKNK